MNRVRITDRQVEILGIISRLLAANGYPPTIAELRTAISVASNRGVTVHLDSLEKKGLIERQPYLARSLRITKEGRSVLLSSELASASM